MPDEPFLMLSLKDDQAKKLANVLTNKSASQILQYLANHKGVTESDIAKALKLPLSTVNYNMKAMVEARLVVADEYHYSSRGKEVNHYKLARKYIIIAPDEEQAGFWERVKKYVPIGLVALGTASVARLLSLTVRVGDAVNAAPMLGDAAPFAMDAAAGVQEAASEAARRVADEAVAYGAGAAPEFAAKAAMAPLPASLPAQPTLLQTFFGDWFGWVLLGIFLVLLAALVIEYLYWKRK